MQKAQKSALCRTMWSVTPFGVLDANHGDTRQHGVVTFRTLRTATVAERFSMVELRIKEWNPSTFSGECWSTAEEQSARRKLRIRS